jgi:hypothetical protein
MNLQVAGLWEAVRHGGVEYRDDIHALDSGGRGSCESATRGQITVEFVGTENQLGDVLTKSLRRVKFQELCNRIGIINTRGRMLLINLVCLVMF